ncbi:MAG: hypothetical protein LBD20_03395 [Spirochaetaceae bacterium]|jgi:hypothetical protein|nr:hypothetical protein [Spirochaetaceae bacterium]
MKSKWPVLGMGIVIFAAGCLLAACAEEVKSAKKAPYQEADLGEFSVEPASMALFADGGEKRLTAVFSREAAALAKVEWSAGDPDVAEVEIHGEIATVKPKGAGNTTVTAKLVPRQEGVTLDMRVTEIICPITVISEFKLDNQQLLFFEGEAAQSLAAIIPEAVLQVAKIIWTVETAQQGAIAITGEGPTVSVAASGVETLGIITAKLEALNEDAFNGTGRSAVCAVTALEAPYIEVPPASYMLNAPGQPERTSLITAQYGPGRIDMWQPQVVWTSAAPAVARFEGTGSASLGRATTHITAASVGTAAVTAELTVAGRNITNTNQVQVSAYQAPAVPVVAVSISPKPASLTKTDRTALITATLSGSGGGEPSDPMVEWDVSETGVVEIIYDESSQAHTKVWLEGVWNGAAAKTVTVTARSHSNTAVSDTFSITVNPIAVTVTTTPAGGSTIVTKGGSISLNAAVNLSSTGNRNIDSWTSDPPNIVSVTASGPGNTDAEVVVQDDAVVTAATTVRIMAYAAADFVTYGSIVLTINPHTFKITYHKNDGSAQPATAPNVPYTYGDGSQSLRTIATLNWTKAGHVFKGWTFAAENENLDAALPDGASITALNSNAAAKTPNGTVTLYAKWEVPVYTFTILKASNWAEAIDTINTEGSGTAEHPKLYRFTVTGDFGLEQVGQGRNPAITAQYIDVCFTATAPRTITHTGDRYQILKITDNQKITIHNINFVGIDNRSALVSIIASPAGTKGWEYAELVMEGSSSISENTNGNGAPTIRGGGVYVEGGILTMKDDASIHHNISRVSGGGVVLNGGTVSMQGNSSITDNEARERGGGIAFFRDVSDHVTSLSEDFSGYVVTMEGDSHISNNHAFRGGGVYGGVTMYDNSSINYNSASRMGGGIFSISGTKMRDNSTVHHNSISTDDPGATSSIVGGGGLYIIDHSYMYDNARVYENEADGAFGGGICIDSRGTENSGLNSDGSYSGRIDSNGILVMTNSSKIDHNSAVAGGGVAFIPSNVISGLGMGGGQISDNTSSLPDSNIGLQLVILSQYDTVIRPFPVKYGAAYFVPSEPPDLSLGTNIGTDPSSNEEYSYNSNFAVRENGTQFVRLVE